MTNESEQLTKTLQRSTKQDKTYRIFRAIRHTGL